MATGDFAYLRTDAAGTLGVPAFTSLPTTEQAQVDAIINEAYRECFITPDGKRPRWTEQYVSFLLKAPLSLTVTLTNGAKTLGSPTATLEAAYAGSLIKIGSTFYTYAGKASSTDYMVEPWDGATGDQVVTFYYCSYVLPLESIDLCDEPEVLGVGRLSAMTGREQEIRNRSYTTGDIEPETGWGWRQYSIGPAGADYQTGEPAFYFIDAASLNPNDVFSSRYRFTVYPLPDSNSRTVRMRANIVPAAMTTGTEVPVLPANAVTDILLPIIRMKLAQTMRRFNGNNKADLIDLGQNALRKLGTLASPQKKGRIRVSVRGNY